MRSSYPSVVKCLEELWTAVMQKKKSPRRYRFILPIHTASCLYFFLSIRSTSSQTYFVPGYMHIA